MGCGINLHTTIGEYVTIENLNGGLHVKTWPRGKYSNMNYNCGETHGKTLRYCLHCAKKLGYIW